VVLTQVQTGAQGGTQQSTTGLSREELCAVLGQLLDNPAVRVVHCDPQVVTLFPPPRPCRRALTSLMCRRLVAKLGLPGFRAFPKRLLMPLVHSLTTTCGWRCRR
jgi:hypothetical protein